ncbi:hypothetical protein C1H46_009004 [Malus baccata]|uniref:Uncharacterized protein n=1 Tax=Malus baccata TaxID=106549 RepID=A0A540N324_MALBA|nr:hypothetical protein C1H46_009004 [Malus baccata]
MRLAERRMREGEGGRKSERDRDLVRGRRLQVDRVTGVYDSRERGRERERERERER